MYLFILFYLFTYWRIKEVYQHNFKYLLVVNIRIWLWESKSKYFLMVIDQLITLGLS